MKKILVATTTLIATGMRCPPECRQWIRSSWNWAAIPSGSSPGVDLQGLVGYGDYKASTGGVARTADDQNKGWTVLTGVAVQF